jgi:hypothetical protein
VLGPPNLRDRAGGSLDVLSLGAGGEIVLAFGDHAIVDGPGPDIVVFENAFYPNGDRTKVYAEPGEVAISEDGQTFVSFECQAEGVGDGTYPGCAGVTPTLAYDPLLVDPIDPELTGGDAFDLGALDLARANFVRIRDLSTEGRGSAAGFDLDAVGVVHTEPRE